MRKLMIAAVLVFGIGLFAQDQKATGPVVCVSTVTDSTGKAIGPLGNLNNDIAQEITDRRKPLRGLGVAADINGKVLPSEDCDYVLEITLHVGGSTTIGLNPIKTNPNDPSLNPQGANSKWLVQAFYKLNSTKKSGQNIRFEDDAKDQYEPNVGGYGTDVGSVARRLAQAVAYNATGKLKKKLKL